jgi:hypothetical protein
MKIKLFILLNLSAVCLLSSMLSGCVASPSPSSGEVGGIYGQDPYQKQIARQEAISRQQRSLMR